MEFGKKQRTYAILAVGVLGLAAACASGGNQQPGPAKTTAASASPAPTATGGEKCVALDQWTPMTAQESATDIEAIAKTLGVSVNEVKAGFIGPAACDPAITFDQVHAGIRIPMMIVDGKTLGPCTPAQLATTDGQPPREGESWVAVQGMACAA